MYIRVLRRQTILYAGSMVLAIAICVTFILPVETKKLPHTDLFSKDITLEGVLYFLLRNLQICGPLLLAIGMLMLALGCCSRTLEHGRGNFADLYESNLNLEQTTIASDEDVEMAEHFNGINGQYGIGMHNMSIGDDLQSSINDQSDNRDTINVNDLHDMNLKYKTSHNFNLNNQDVDSNLESIYTHSERGRDVNSSRGTLSSRPEVTGGNELTDEIEYVNESSRSKKNLPVSKRP